MDPPLKDLIINMPFGGYISEFSSSGSSLVCAHQGTLTVNGICQMLHAKDLVSMYFKRYCFHAEHFFHIRNVLKFFS